MTNEIAKNSDTHGKLWKKISKYPKIKNNHSNKLWLQHIHLKKLNRRLVRAAKAKYGCNVIQDVNDGKTNVYTAFRRLKKCKLTSQRLSHIPFFRQIDKETQRIQEIHDDFTKAELLSIKFSHRGHTPQYNILDDLDLSNIPLYDFNIYPKADLERAEYIPNPKLHANYQAEHSTAFTRPLQRNEIRYAYK